MVRHAVIALPLVLASPAWAQDIPPEHEALMDVLQMDRVVSIMRAEGVQQGEALAEDLFPNRGEAGWRVSVERIYDEGLMRQRLRDGISDALEGEDVGAMTAFFTSDPGERIVELELDAREAMSEEDVEEAARGAWTLMAEDDPERAALIDRFIEVNDLLEENVVGALNGNFEFVTGLSQGGAFPNPAPEDEILADVWSSEPAVRQEVHDWLGGFLSMAYAPLDDADLDAYIAFSETPVGQAMNRALFEGFDAMYEGVNLDLGRAAAAQMAGQEI